MKSEITLLAYVNSRQENSYYYFIRQEYLKLSGASNYSFNQAIYRLTKQRRVKHIVNSFYIIVPLEYKHRGIIPIEWFINDLMKHLELDYYVCLLTAASILGFTHQQPQVFQIMINKQRKLGRLDKTSISCVIKKDIVTNFFQKQKSETGYYNLAKKETVVFDIIEYNYLSGYLNNIGTILYEIGSELDEKLLANLAINYPIAVIQRLGYLLDFLGHSDKTTGLYNFFTNKLAEQKINYTVLSPGDLKNDTKNKKWRIIINEEVDIDL